MTRVKNILEEYENKGTQRNLKNSIRLFLKSIYNDMPNNPTIEDLDNFAERYFTEKREYEKDIQNYITSLNGQTPLSIRLKLSTIKTFLIENEIDLPQKSWRKVGRKIKGSRAQTLDRIPTTSELKKIIMHMPIHGKAFYLCLESSGMRRGELLETKLEDIHLDETPPRIEISGKITKTGNSRHTFISREAKETVEEWLKVREDYIKSAIGKSHKYTKSLDDDRLFPFKDSTAYSLWIKALHKSGLNGRDQNTDREKLHPHVLRKFFRTKLAGSGVPVDIVETLMGHEGYLKDVYKKYSLKDLQKFYLKGESVLLVFTDTQKVVELHKQIEEKNTQLQVLVNSLATENQQIKQKLDKLAKEVEWMRGFFRNLEPKQ